MKPVNPFDLGFLLLERRNQPLHVGGLMLLTPPEGTTSREFVEQFKTKVLEYNKAERPFNQRLRQRAGVWFWDEDKDFDIEAHVHHLALPEPGRIRELLALVSKLHSSLLDRTKPLWELYLIEGVEGGRIGVYSKVHHALVDGVTSMRLLHKSTTDNPHDSVAPVWALPPKKRKQRPAAQKSSPLEAVVQAASQLTSQAGSVRKVAQEVLKSIRARREDPDYVSVFQAPRTVFNQRISGGRRFAAQSYPFARIKAAGEKHGATINDIILAMCGSALRRYLQDINQLPEKPLVAMVPVSMHKADDDAESGNQVAMVLANLATHLDDPQERLATTIRSVKNSKERFARMSQSEIMGYLGTVMAVHGVNMAFGINPGWQAFNIAISNVPGPKTTRYWNGARIDGLYPVSIPMDGAALNITLNSYADNLEFGLIACHRTLPHMQRLLQYLDDGLAELE